jgi:hypothetical protein
VPTYNFSGKKGARFCENHKLEGMVTKTLSCAFDDCQKVPTFNDPGLCDPLYCAEHRPEGMICVRKQKQHCAHEGCSVYPSFNFEGSRGKRFCAAHKLIGMVEMKKRICEAPDCTLHASFNHPHLKKRRFCASHREPGMVTVGRCRSVPSEASATDALIACLATIHDEANDRGNHKRSIAELENSADTIACVGGHIFSRNHPREFPRGDEGDDKNKSPPDTTSALV